VGGGKKTGGIGPAFGKPGVFENMPEGIGGPSRYKTLGDEFQVRGGFSIGKTIKIPSKKLIKFTGRGNPFQNLGQINPHPGFSAVTGEGINTYFH
jgi:hypothetical protein